MQKVLIDVKKSNMNIEIKIDIWREKKGYPSMIDYHMTLTDVEIKELALNKFKEEFTTCDEFRYKAEIDKIKTS